MGKFVTLYARAPLNSAANVAKYWADYRANRATKEDPRMPIEKSTTDVAWAAVSALAWELVQRKKAATFEEAVEQLKTASHPSYLTYLSSLRGDSAPADVPTPEGVIKRADAEAMAQRDAVCSEVRKRVDHLVRSGQAVTEDAAMHQMSKDDPALYAKYRKASYSRGPLPAVTPDTTVLPPTPVWDAIRKMALALRDSDRQYAGKSETELVQAVFDDNHALHAAYRREVAGR